ncbi:metastasis-associated protein MTA3-like isoform X2 [Lytechinus pictus]|uniref:metastasis-associated protein MTA3-like isoform X2 n=1 Tax=Lytechinus pictus TaxID=7653 RepID=UPI0030BA269A
MAANMYRVGDYVYFETSSSQPYLIRRIEELNKTASGNVEAKVVCFYRRRDIPNSLIQLADKHAMALEEEQEEALEELNEKQRHQLKHRELFLSRQLETLPATHIRGKCTVTLLNETESLLSYLSKDDAFFYSLVYDPQQKTLLADKGEIRVGSRYQADVTPLLTEGESDGRDLSSLEALTWNPEHCMNDRSIDQFLVLARSVGTFGRALDCSSSIRQPSLHMSAAAASRDITLFHAMDVLHQQAYELAKAMAILVPAGGPVICRDQLEEWSASEANLFEEALEKYGKDFNDIRQDFLPWKSLKSIVEYYYMWKTTDRYVQQKRLKAAEAESKLKQVYIPTYNKPNPNQINVASNLGNRPSGLIAGGNPLGQGPPQVQPCARACESCHASNSFQWYSWGPANMQCRLCATCWVYWKKCGGLKMPTRLDGERPGNLRNRTERPPMPLSGMHRPFCCTISGCGKEFKLKAHLARHCQTVHGLTIRTSNPRALSLKTRQAFMLVTTPLTRLSRFLCKNMLNLPHVARCPFDPINVAAVKQECQNQLTPGVIPTMPKLKPKVWARVDIVMANLDQDRPKKPVPQRPTPNGNVRPQLTNPVGTLTPNIRKRQLDDNGGREEKKRKEGPQTKRTTITAPRQYRRTEYDEDGKLREVGQGDPLSRRKRPISWLDAPDDVFFHADSNTRKLRKQLSVQAQRRLARRPWTMAVRPLNAGVIPPPQPAGSPSAVKPPTDPIVIDDD